MPVDEYETLGSVQREEVGLWFLCDDPAFSTFQCDGCGAVSHYIYSDLPIQLGEPCEDCGGVPTHLLGAVQHDGQLTLIPDSDLDALVVLAPT